jgi:hypothetical protein
MSENPLFGDQDPAFLEPSAEQLLALEAAADNYFSDEHSLSEQAVSVELGGGYTIHLTKKGIARLEGGKPVNLDAEGARELYDEEKYDTDQYRDIAEDGRRLYIDLTLPDASSLHIRSYLDADTDNFGYGYTGMVHNPPKQRTIGEVQDLYSQVEGYDGFEASRGQLERIAKLTSLALEAIEQKEVNGKPTIDIREVQDCVKYLVDTSNTYDVPGEEGYKTATVDQIKAMQDTVLPVIEQQPTDIHFRDHLYAKYHKGLPVAEAGLGYAITVNPDGGIQKRVNMRIEESQDIENSLDNAVVTLFEKTVDGEVYCSSFPTISEEGQAAKASPKNWTAIIMGQSLESMLEDGILSQEEYDNYRTSSSLWEAAKRSRKVAEENIQSEMQSGFHSASLQDVTRVTDLIYDMCLQRYPDKHPGLQENLKQLNEQVDELVEGQLDIAKKRERLEFSDGSSIDFEQQVIVQYRNSQVVELTKKELDEYYAAEGSNDRWEEDYINKFLVSFNMPNRISAYITGRIGDEEAIGCYYEDWDTTGKSLHTRLSGKVESLDKNDEEFEAANQAQVAAITDILGMINAVLSKRIDPENKLVFGQEDLKVNAWQLLEATAVKNGNSKHAPTAESIRSLHELLIACLSNAHLNADFTVYSSPPKKDERGMPATIGAYVSRTVEGYPSTGYRKGVQLSASEYLDIPALNQLNGVDMWSFKLDQAGSDITIEDTLLSAEDLTDLFDDMAKLQAAEEKNLSYQEVKELLQSGEITVDEYRLHTTGANWLNAKWLLRQGSMHSNSRRKAALNDLERALSFVRLIKEYKR